jgi:uncharacterized damage-inducible protein DinB
MASLAPTEEHDIEALRFPVGRFEPRAGLTADERGALIAEIAALPERISRSVAGLEAERLDTPYRPGGWTVRQVVHHLADSHMNSYTRFKLAATEEEPTIKPYDEAAWAELVDGRDEEVEVSLELLSALHRRWTVFLRSLAPDDFQRPFRHPEQGRVTLEWNLQFYAWHGRHHLAHVEKLGERMGW